MLHLIRKSLFGLVLSLDTLLASSSLASARDPVADLQKVVKDWNTRQQRSCTASYTVVGESLVPKGRFTGDPALPPEQEGEVPPQDHSSPKEVTWIVDFEKSLVRKETREERFFVPLAAFCPSFAVNIHDGTGLKVFEPREENTSERYTPGAKQPDLLLQTPHYASLFFGPSDYPLFLAHGFIPDGTTALDPRRIRRSIDPEGFRVCGMHRMEGREYLILRTRASQDRFAQTDEFWVDPAKESAIVRWIRTVEGSLFLQNDIEYEQTADGWLPAGWTTTIYDPQRDLKRLFLSERLRVRERRVNQTLFPESFQVQLKPGMVVKDVALAQYHRVADDGKTLTDISHDPPVQQGRNANPLLAMFLAANLILVGILLLRRMSRSSRWRRTVPTSD